MKPHPKPSIRHSVATTVASGSLLLAAFACANPVTRQPTTIPTAGGNPVPAYVFAVSPDEARVRVLTSRDLKRDNASNHGISVREAEDTRTVGAAVAMHALLVNGGFSESVTERPAGLLVSDGVVVSLADYAVRRADAKSDCPLRHKDTLKLSGVLCVTGRAQASIEDVATLNPTTCRQAIQAGPLLVEKAGEAAICPMPNAERTHRTAVCVRRKQMLIVVTAEGISLYDLAKWLATPETSGGLACDRALNLSGDTSSGAVYFPGGLPSITRRVRVGPGSYPLPSLILVESRRLP